MVFNTQYVYTTALHQHVNAQVFCCYERLRTSLALSVRTAPRSTYPDVTVYMWHIQHTQTHTLNTCAVSYRTNPRAQRHNFNRILDAHLHQSGSC
jgi:hypothetical protein